MDNAVPKGDYEPKVGQLMQLHVARQNDGSIHISTIAAKMPKDKRSQTYRYPVSSEQQKGVDEKIVELVGKMRG